MECDCALISKKYTELYIKRIASWVSLGASALQSSQAVSVPVAALAMGKGLW